MKRILGYAAYLLVLLLGVSAFASGYFEPTPGWTIFAILPAAAATWFVTKVAGEESRIATARPKRRRVLFPFVLGALIFIGPYLFANWVVGTVLTALLGESHSRPAVVHFADAGYRTSRRGTCQRVGATIQTPGREIHVSQCMRRTYALLPEPGSTVYYQTRESFIGALVEPRVFAPP